MSAKYLNNKNSFFPKWLTVANVDIDFGVIIYLIINLILKRSDKI